MTSKDNVIFGVGASVGCKNSINRKLLSIRTSNKRKINKLGHFFNSSFT